MQINQKKAVWWCLGLGTALLIAAGAVWWNGVYQSPEHVFWAALDNNLSTTSVTRRVSYGQTGQSIEEYSQVAFGAHPTVQTRTHLVQGTTKVTTENIATPKESYVRWTSITTGQKNAKGQPLNFGNLLNTWGKTANDTDTFPAAVLETQAGIPLPPIGNLALDQRQKLLDFIRQNSVFSTAYSGATKQMVNGQPAYVFTVQVPLQSYVVMMQQFAHDEGIKSLDKLDPASYANSAPMTITMAMGRTSHQLLQVGYGNGKYTEDYSDYGLQVRPTLPTHSISATELEAKLQNIH